MNYKKLPVYTQKQRILDTLAQNQVVVVQSPTGSGKTTQIPVILHEAGYSDNGIIAVTQPRRIAALSVSEFIAKQLGTTYPGVVGYKMRFDDKTDATTKIKIMTDGILLQEMKLDPWMSKYSVIMVDEAHERSLNIDFVLGLLKRVLAERSDFKVIVSSATMNAEAFSQYFDGCPIVTIDTITYPVTMVYDPPAIPTSTASPAAEDALLMKIEQTIDRVLDNRHTGDILCFLPGEKVIKDCMSRLQKASFSRKIHCVPLYGRLAKEEQERVFDNPPFGKKKVVISTNIAETSVTIPGITTVIDSGLAKMNFYNPRTYTSSLNETTVSKASCNQRKGRAGRTKPGVCYRLYQRKDYETRELYTTEEIYRTDLSEVVLRMAELGITDFYSFDFISKPNREGMRGAIETLNLLQALNPDNTLSTTGLLMAEFPLIPRVSRIIAESIMRYPGVIEDVLIAAAFLSAQSPFVLPQGEETDARQAHHRFRHEAGDFVAYVNLYRLFQNAWERHESQEFCKKNYLDERVLLEITNIKQQLEQIVGDKGIPIVSSGNIEEYLTCICAGLIQFVCVRSGKENYRTLTQEHIQIHPGSCLFRTEPLYFVAGEIVRTSRMFAMSVSPLTKRILQNLDGNMVERLGAVKGDSGRSSDETLTARQRRELEKIEKASKKAEKAVTEPADENSVNLCGVRFEKKKIKGKPHLIMPLDKLLQALQQEGIAEESRQYRTTKCVVTYADWSLLQDEKLETIMQVVPKLNLQPLAREDWNPKENLHMAEDAAVLAQRLPLIMRLTAAKVKAKELGFICLFTDGRGSYWFKVSRGITTAVNESIASLETLIDESADVFTEDQKDILNSTYRLLNELL